MGVATSSSVYPRHLPSFGADDHVSAVYAAAAAAGAGARPRAAGAGARAGRIRRGPAHRVVLGVRPAAALVAQRGRNHLACLELERLHHERALRLGGSDDAHGRGLRRERRRAAEVRLQRQHQHGARPRLLACVERPVGRREQWRRRLHAPVGLEPDWLQFLLHVPRCQLPVQRELHSAWKQHANGPLRHGRAAAAPRAAAGAHGRAGRVAAGRRGRLLRALCM